MIEPSMMKHPSTVLSGVFPVVPTPFLDSGEIDIRSIRRLVRYLLQCGVDGLTFPGVASEISHLTADEHGRLLKEIIEEVDGRLPIIAGVTRPEAAITLELCELAVDSGAAALMISAPRNCPDTNAQIKFFAAIEAAVPGATLMLQNVPSPVGAGLEPHSVLEILRNVPSIRYVKEETLPSGQRLTALNEGSPETLAGVFGGAGGRYITDELRRGAIGTMPAAELTEVHVALFAAHRAGNAPLVRHIFTRMLPILNVQAVFRWALTKYILQARGLIASAYQRAPGPAIDAMNAQDVDAFLADLDDLLLPRKVLCSVTERYHG